MKGDGDGGQVGVDKKPVQTENNLTNHTELQNADLNAKINSSKTVSYERPSQFRKGVRDKVWENAKSEDGRVYDPLTHKEMDQSEPWDMGHKKGYEFKKHKLSAENRGISRKEFLDEYNNPEHYQPELPSSNRSHKNEDKTDEYFGD
ncbi:MAG: HNH/ENDO VII family nuclease [Anaerofustis sp.]